MQAIARPFQSRAQPHLGQAWGVAESGIREYVLAHGREFAGQGFKLNELRGRWGPVGKLGALSRS